MSVFGYIVFRKEHTGEVVSEWQVGGRARGLSVDEVVAHHGIDDETKRLEAATLNTEPHASALDIRVTWTGVEPTDEVESALYSWVLWQLKSK